MNITKRILSLFLIATCTLTACVEPIDEQAIIDARIAKKVKDYKARRLKECKIKASDRAETYVDSLIANWVGSEVMDTIAFPDRPPRPERPDAILGTVKKFDIK